MAEKTSIYVNETLSTRIAPILKRLAAAESDKPRGISAAITLVADRYGSLMARERRALRDLFNKSERNLMLSNALSTIYEPADIIPGAVLADTEDEEDHVFEVDGIDRAALLDKLRGLNLGQQYALVDWLEEMRANLNPEN
ncbi:MAG: hypothetical protein KKB59_10625 [Spirochaetes bacterium]|nr:hypothetical protein [Spirochaetota bacterium]